MKPAQYISSGPFDPLAQATFAGAPISIPPKIIYKMLGINTMPGAGGVAQFPYLTTPALLRHMKTDLCAIHVHRLVTMYSSRTPGEVLSFFIRRGFKNIVLWCQEGTDYSYDRVAYELANLIRAANIANVPRVRSRLTTPASRTVTLFGVELVLKRV